MRYRLFCNLKEALVGWSEALLITVPSAVISFVLMAFHVKPGYFSRSERVQIAILFCALYLLLCAACYAVLKVWKACSRQQWEQKVAIHEAGHAVICYCLQYKQITEANITGENAGCGAAGCVFYASDRDDLSEYFFQKQVMVCLAGEAAEKCLGVKMPGIGSSDDYRQAYKSALAIYRLRKGSQNAGRLKSRRRGAAVSALMRELRQEAYQLAYDRRDAIEALAEQLLQQKKLDGSAVETTLSQYKNSLVI